MSKKYKSTEFSAHLSRSRMRKYLDNALTEQEKQEVELHLKHCAHCSNIIVAYVEQEEPEHYKVHMAKLKNKLTSSVKPRKPKFSPARIKVIRAAAAVVALFVFSFFALGSMAEKDFNFITDAGKRGNELPELKTNPKPIQKPKASTSTPTEQKTDEIYDYSVNDYENEEEETEEEEKPATPVAKPKTQVVAAKPKVTEPKQEEEIKTAAPAKPTPTLAASSPAVTETAAEKKENTTKEEEGEEKVAETENQEEDKVEVVKTIQPLQKIEKIDAGIQNKVVPEEQTIQSIPNNGVGQLPQR